ncbi:MAG: hypothetical protein HY900_11020 [Deltaproteobacteria bacterium]|nr:hypothetical protein [Deltaproteobacteria bacterium]
MYKDDLSLEQILDIQVDRERLERVKSLVRFDIPGISEEVKDFLVSQQLEFVNIQYARFMAGVKFTQQDVLDLLRGVVDCHAHGGSDPFDRLLLEDEIAMEYSRVGARAVVFKTWFTPSASRIALARKYLRKWGDETGIEPAEIFGGITLNSSVGGINPDAVKRCLGFPCFQYVWLPMVDSYHHRRLVYDDWSGAGIRLLDEKGRVLPEVTEVLRIAADRDLIVGSGHYPYADTKVVFEEAKRVGVKRLEIVHPAHIHSKTLISEMKEAASEGVKLMLSGLGTTAFPLHETGPVYAVRMLREVGAEHFCYGSDFGQIHNPSHVIGTEWTIKLLFAYGASKDDLKKVFQTNPARHLGLDSR